MVHIKKNKPKNSNPLQLPPAAAAAAKSLQLCPTLCDPIDGSPPHQNTFTFLESNVYTRWSLKGHKELGHEY